MQRSGKLQPFARQVLLGSSIAVAAFFVGRHFSHRSVDFIVYHKAAQSLLAGRTDLYSDTFSTGHPPTQYSYPPLFVLMIFPLGWLGFSNGVGVWFALMMLATVGVIKKAYHHWRPQNRARYALLLVALAGPYCVLVLRYGNIHFPVVLLTVLAVLAWSRGKPWPASFCLALGGAIKIFPLFLIPVFVVRREWSLAARVVGFSAILWLLPALYFGPPKTLALYQSWYDIVSRDISYFKRQRAVDLSLEGSLGRWLTRVDYSQYKDPAYPQANLTELSQRVVQLATAIVRLAVLGLSLWMCVLLRQAERPSLTGVNSMGEAGRVTAGCIFVTAQLLLGPYTNILYLTGWLTVALASPVVMRGQERLQRLILGTGILNLLLFAVPGSMNQRAIQAYGVMTVLGLILWALMMQNGWLMARKAEPRPDQSA